MNNHPFWIHSCYVNNGVEDAVVVKEKIQKPDGTFEPNLKVYSNLKRRFWLTQPKYRNHTLKKEYELKNKLDEYIVPQKDLEKELFKELNGFYPSRKPSLKSLCNSPYVYGADIVPEVMVKLKYIKNTPDNVLVPYSEGFLDIETSVLTEDGEIILITVTHENKVYTAINDHFLYKNREKGEPRVKANLDDVKEIVNTTLAGYIKDFDLQIEYQICDNEVDLIKWIFGRIHENKTDFVGVWNIDFDLPKIIKALKKKGIEAKDVFAHPDVPEKFRYSYYRHEKDNPKAKSQKHHTEKWHWLYCTGYTQMLDSMCLYSRLRKVKGLFDSYTLNDTLQREVKLKKLSLGEEGTHYHMQKYRFLDYIAYNIFDAVGLFIMEKQNKDIYSMSVLVGTSVFNQFAYQTVMASNELYDYASSMDAVMASPGNQMEDQYTKLIPAAGGTVLRPERSKGTGLHAIKEHPYLETLLSALVSDLDFSAFYPRTQIGANIAKETKRLTVLAINKSKNAVNKFFSLVISPKENAVKVCEKYFGLSGYKDIDRLAEKVMANNIKKNQN